jgi:hypothetical protein
MGLRISAEVGAARCRGDELAGLQVQRPGAKPARLQGEAQFTIAFTQFGVELPQRFLSTSTVSDLSLRRLKKASVVYCGSSLTGDTDQQLLVFVDKLSRLAVSEEEPADYLTAS